VRRLEDRVAIVTGGASGIGEATVHHHAVEEAAVVVSDIDAALAEQVAKAVVDAGGRATAARVDVRVRAEIDEVVELTISTSADSTSSTTTPASPPWRRWRSSTQPPSTKFST
jgi:NAD(P)-dependent dehydrogenase (short-subunit alcohol dehydrogenase family)